jgi:hypothetical protein
MADEAAHLRVVTELVSAVAGDPPHETTLDNPASSAGDLDNLRGCAVHEPSPGVRPTRSRKLSCNGSRIREPYIPRIP